MNKGLRRVEKLVDATNSTLAQIKSSLTFDDWSAKPGREPKRDAVSRSSHEYSFCPQELQHLDHDFKSQANKMLSDMDKLLNSNKISYTRADESRSSRVRHKMKEINDKIESLRSEESTANETKQSRQKLLRLVNEDFHGPGEAEGSHKESEANKQIFFIECERSLEKESLLRKHEPEKSFQSNQKSKEELKSKILETQNIVDRGFQTARQLTQKVENMSKAEIKCEKTPSSEITVISEPPNLKSLNRSRRSRSFEAFGVDRSRRRSCRHADKEKKNSGQKEKNVLVKMKRAERGGAAAPQLKFQRLPSLHIKSGLQLQAIHNLEILPENSEPASSKTNTAVNILSHEKIENEKKKKMLEEFEKENWVFLKDESSGDSVKCYNCGKLMKMQKKTMDSREIDKVLLDCNFNVFDPRIEEFVDKWNEGGGGSAHCFFPVEKEKSREREEIKFLENKESEKAASSTAIFNKGKSDSTGKRLKIKELIEELSQKYKEKVNNLEDDHLRVESILRNLYDKVSQSKEFFHVCKHSSLSGKQKVDFRKLGNLSATTPLVICLADEADVPELPISRPSDAPDTLPRKPVQKKSGKKPRKKEWARRSAECNGYRKSPEVNTNKKEIESKSEKGVPKDLVFWPTNVFREHEMDIENKSVGNKSLSSSASKREAEPSFAQIRVSVSEKTENDYESDFEGESLGGEEIGENQEENNPGFNNLSTVSEGNFEFEKRFNDFNKRKKDAIDENYLAVFETRKNLIDGIEMVNNEEISKGVNEVAGKNVDKKVAYTLQDQRNALKTSHKLKESVASFPSSSSANPYDLNESGNLKAENKKQENENSGRFKNILLSESKRGKERKSHSEASLSRKSSSTEVVASLKEILTALKDQFVKTQLLADKLTENVKDLSDKKERADVVFTQRDTFSRDLNLRNLQKRNKDIGGDDLCSLTSKMTTLPVLAKACSAKKEKVDERNSFSENSFSEDSPRKEEVSSAGEVNVYNLNSANLVFSRKRTNCEKSRKSSNSSNDYKITSNRGESCRRSSLHKNSAGEKNSASIFTLESEHGETYSEGEIESQGLAEAECVSIHSVGEVISEIMTASSIME